MPSRRRAFYAKRPVELGASVRTNVSPLAEETGNRNNELTCSVSLPCPDPPMRQTRPFRATRRPRPPSDGSAASAINGCIAVFVAACVFAVMFSDAIVPSNWVTAIPPVSVWGSHRFLGYSGKLPGTALLVVSAGGSGTSALIDTLTVRLRDHRVKVNDVNDE